MLQRLQITKSLEATVKWGRNRNVRVENRGRKEEQIVQYDENHLSFS